MRFALEAAGFSNALINGTPRWTHPNYIGVRLYVGVEIVRIEVRKVNPSKKRMNLRGTWINVGSIDIPENDDSKAELAFELISLGNEVYGLKNQTFVGPAANSSIRSHAISASGTAGGGKLRDMPERLGFFGWNNATGKRLLTRKSKRHENISTPYKSRIED